MKTLDFLTVAFSALAIAASAAAAGLFVQRKSQKGEPPSSIIFAVLSFCFLAVGCLGYLFSGAAVVLPVTVFLAVLCLNRAGEIFCQRCRGSVCVADGAGGAGHLGGSEA